MARQGFLVPEPAKARASTNARGMAGYAHDRSAFSGGGDKSRIAPIIHLLSRERRRPVYN
jgi:hypothetical protein